MTRRALLGTLFAAPAAAQFQTDRELERDFFQLTNAFVLSWNRVTEMMIKGTWDYKVAGECEKAFKRLTEHPMWLKAKK